ncbi:riboflavin kinase / FMN adenylyltransferase [Clostridium collagenovorans DSM 3089]|uniref:Riboflavin biosynthesis protein n=1 Tax=Clostridium collagenovorans DSM 3089 TaxID=1121306 RepID=A0A1M5SWI2_9CLOT|nr:bifunctional riboflavin kinase/FAD synthetase [Clostridium collagenovorans]SHH42867.1 riboflavin kinase / FMN adenylyltransferase [Clostridium collagenovorans DSM 3089]
MLVIRDNFCENFNESTIVALGSFDGVHKGHIELIKKTKELASKNNIKSMVFTFENHPLSTINYEIMPKLLQSTEEKIKTLDSLGIDILNLCQFNNDFMELSPEEFIRKLVTHYKVKGIVVGFNYRFGYKNLGDVELLIEFSKKLDFELHIVSPITMDGEIISSTKIRALIAQGEVKKANELLTRPYYVHGKVIKGKQLGRTLGFPTINLDYDKKFALPLGGVYYTVVEYKDKFYKGITNIGYNPTVNGNKLSVETHIIDFEEVIYDKEVKVFFIERIRNEKCFNSLDELQTQLNKDKLYAKNKEIRM